VSSWQSSSSQRCQTNGLATVRATMEARSWNATTFGKQGANAAETTSSAAIGAFFKCSLRIFLFGG
jgi:hypothetical protein